jgi:hypothetical protein
VELVRLRRANPDDGCVTKKRLSEVVRGKKENLLRLYDGLKTNLIVDNVDYAPFVELTVATEAGQETVRLRATEEAVASGKWHSADGFPMAGTRPAKRTGSRRRGTRGNP